MLPVKLNTGAQTRGGRTAHVAFEVPLYVECAAKENKIGNVTWIPFFGTRLFSKEGTPSQTYGFPYVLGAFVGMIAGILVGTLVEFVLKILLTPNYGRLLAKRPLTVFSVFNDSEDLVGLSFRFGEKKRTLKSIFENDEIACEVIALSPQENG
jgi:hypothetical protein